jgi:hypothetical protein
MIQFSMKPQPDGSMVGHDTVTRPLSLAVQEDDTLEDLVSGGASLYVALQHDYTLSGCCSVTEPLTVISAPLEEVDQSVIMLLYNNQDIFLDKDEVTIN